ncbi:MAG: four helix bundle protein [Bacteroidia bacterium]
MKYQDLKTRTLKFAATVWRICDGLPNTQTYNSYANQLIRASSPVGANYRAALRGKSTADFINKLKIVEEEADETCYFLELLIEVNPNLEKTINQVLNESKEITAIIVASIKTARSKTARSKIK